MNMLNRTDIWMDLNYIGQVFLPPKTDLKCMFPIPKVLHLHFYGSYQITGF